MTDAYKFAMSNGVVLNRLYPYRAVVSSTGCPMDLRKVSNIRVDGYVEYENITETELQRLVSTIGPISIAVDARWQSMQFYDFGVYYEPRCDPNEINHAVLGED